MNKWNSIARQWVCKHIPATHQKATIGRLLLGNRGAVNEVLKEILGETMNQWVGTN
jgi:hypothetical protein